MCGGCPTRHAVHGDASDCTAVDGGRILNGGERFTLPAIQPAQSYLIVLRVHAASPARLTIGCNETMDTVVIPDIPGNWVEIAFAIPAGMLNPDHPRLCITADRGNLYTSYRTWIYAGSWPAISTAQEAQARFVEPDGTAKVSLADVTFEQAAGALALHFTWDSDGSLTRDGKLFVHLYADPDQPPVAQIDVRPGAGVLPPANWLAGMWSETISLPLDGLAPGTYQLAVGLYDPVSSLRYTITDSSATDGSGRLFLGEIRVDKSSSPTTSPRLNAPHPGSAKAAELPSPDCSWRGEKSGKCGYILRQTRSPVPIGTIRASTRGSANT